ncbi:MAG: Hpt domain-containing protein [Pseudomonadota bacterium]
MIDWARVSELKADIGEDIFEELLPIFLEEISEALETLKGQETTAEIAATAHFIKGSASNLGFSVLTEVSGKGEICAKAGNFPEDFHQHLLNAFEGSKAALLS